MSNALERLAALTNGPSRTIVEIIRVNDGVSAVVRHNDGSESIALGQNLALGKAYLEEDKIIGKAPDLPFSEISI